MYEYDIKLTSYQLVMSSYPVINKEKHTVTKEIIKMPNGTQFLAALYESIDTITIYFGGETTYCVEIQVNKEGSIFSRLPTFDLSEGILTQVYYNEACAVNRPFMRGIDTQTLIRVAIHYTNTKYPYITKLMLNDKSYRECDNSKTIDLAYSEYLLHGKTWYMRNFDAVFKNPANAILFETESKKFQSMMKNTITWEMMYVIMNYTDILPPLQLKEYFDTSDTWQQFFRKIRDVIGAGEFCEFLVPWFKQFLTTFLNFRFESYPYILNLSSPKLQNLPEYTTIKYQEGGKRKTRKNYRKKKTMQGAWF